MFSKVFFSISFRRLAVCSKRSYPFSLP